jgi:hypothetical protein
MKVGFLKFIKVQVFVYHLLNHMPKWHRSASVPIEIALQKTVLFQTDTAAFIVQIPTASLEHHHPFLSAFCKGNRNPA